MQTANPYASPTGAATDSLWPMEPGELPLASQGKRFLNFVIDTVITSFLSMFVGIVIGVAYAVSAVSSGTAIGPDDEASLESMSFLINLGVIFGYFAITEGLFQRSLAKFITGTRVVTADGGRPSFGQILGRSLARFIPFEPFSFFGGKGFPVGWHDSLSGTRVVQRR
ncbi:MAG: RDD family protein [Planctomycetes bacterium]|nr:RDD family protein [Planctomycetota bacterium]